MKNKALAIFAAMTVVLAACNKNGGNAGQSTAATSAGKASYTMRIGLPTAGKHYTNYCVEEFKAAVEKATNGDIAVQLYPSSQLGTAVQMIQGVQDNSIEGVIIPPSYFTSFAPAAAILDVPYLFNDHKKIPGILNSENNPLNAYMEKRGFKVAGYVRTIPRYILAQKKYQSLKDLANQKIWCLPSDTLQNELRAYSAAPQLLDPSDIAVALETGTVNAAETDVSFMLNMGLGQSAKFLNLIPASALTNIFCFSYDWFNKLPGNYQDVLMTAAQDIIMNRGGDYVDFMYDTSLAGLQAAGVQIVEPSQVFLAELTAAAQGVKDAYVKTDADCAFIFQTLLKMYEEQ